MNLKNIITSSALLFLLPLNITGQTLETDQFLHKMIAAYGGEENLKKLNNQISVWAIHSPIRNHPHKETRYLHLPDQMRVETTANDEIRIVNGAKVYRGALNDKKTDPVLGSMARATTLQLKRLYSPLTLLENKNFLKSASHNGAIIIHHNDGESPLNYYINPKTFFIEKVVGIIQMGTESIEFSTEYSDFKKVNGVYFPHTETKYIRGANTARNSLISINLNAELESALFVGGQTL